jgi:enterochelin esterase family protein
MKRIGSFLIVLVAAGTGAAQDIPLSKILVEGEPWKKVADGLDRLQGLTADRQGNVYAATKEKLLKVGTDGKTTVAADEAGLQGLASAADGRVFACQPAKRRIVSVSEEGKVTVAAEDLAARDVVVTAAGVLYCTVPDEHAVYRVGADGKKKAVDDSIGSPAGLTLWPDEGTLVVGDRASVHLWAFRVEKDGTLSSRDRYYTVRERAGHPGSGTTAVTVDAAGLAYAATAAGVQAYDPTGRLCGVMTKPADGELTGLTFGGAGHDLLYLACGDKLYARKLQGKGVVPGDKK